MTSGGKAISRAPQSDANSYFSLPVSITVEEPHPYAHADYLWSGRAACASLAFKEVDASTIRICSLVDMVSRFVLWPYPR